MKSVFDVEEVQLDENDQIITEGMSEEDIQALQHWNDQEVKNLVVVSDEEDEN